MEYIPSETDELTAVGDSPQKAKSKSSGPRKGLSFLTIPGEIRNWIYDLVLLRDETAHPFNYKPCLCDYLAHERRRPHIPVLLVNKQVNAETTGRLYTRATFMLSTGYDFMSFMTGREHICLYQIPAGDELLPTRHQIRSLYLRVTPEYVAMDDAAGTDIDLLRDAWRAAGKVLASLQALERLTLDLDQVYCTEGCCRISKTVVECFEMINQERLQNERPPVEISILGAWDLDEKNFFMRGIAVDYQDEVEADSPDGSDNDDNDPNIDGNPKNNADNSDEAYPDDSDYPDTTDDEDQHDYDGDSDDEYCNWHYYIDYGPDDEETLASRYQYIHERFDGMDTGHVPNNLSNLAQLHRPSEATKQALLHPWPLAPTLPPLPQPRETQETGHQPPPHRRAQARKSRTMAQAPFLSPVASHTSFPKTPERLVDGK
ncbi:MAG: hypothetical protein Q9181_001824 [Wetmoreana brouardii]